MKTHTQTLNDIIAGSFVAAIVSSFFIIKNFHIGSFKLPQLFYLFIFIGFSTFIIQAINASQYRAVAIDLLKKWGAFIALFFFFIGVNFCFYIFLHTKNILPVDISLNILRFTVNILLGLSMVIHLIHNRKYIVWFMYTFFIPLVMTPLFFFRNIDTVTKAFPFLFSNYALQGLQYNTTSLATWLVITFSLSVVFLFNEITLKRAWKITFFSFIALVVTSFIWWTESRAALLASILIFIFISFLYVQKEKVRITIPFLIGIPLFIFGFILLPPKVRLTEFFRYYPQASQELQGQVLQNIGSGTVRLSTKDVHDKVFSSAPNFVHSQMRLTDWRLYGWYIINHPLGLYQPSISLIPQRNNFIEDEQNTLLEAGLWGGIATSILVGIFILYILTKSLKTIWDNKTNPHLIGLTGAFLGLIILCMLNSFLELKTFILIPALLMVYILQARFENKEEKSF